MPFSRLNQHAQQLILYFSSISLKLRSNFIDKVLAGRRESLGSRRRPYHCSGSGASSVTGEEHRVRIVLPDGFEYKEAEMGNTVYCRVGAGGQLAFELKNTYGQLNAFDWNN